MILFLKFDLQHICLSNIARKNTRHLVILKFNMIHEVFLEGAWIVKGHGT